MTSEQKNFIMSISRGAIEGLRKYQILPSVTMAQAILESGWGKSGLTAKSNNLFGIKAGTWNGETFWNGDYISYPTKEYVNGQYVDTYANFRKYDSFGDSISDHAEFLSGLARYNNIIGDSDYKSVCNKLQKGGYATAPNYASSLVNLIEQYNLHDYDSGLLDITCTTTGGDFDKVKELGDSLALDMTWEAHK